MYICIYIQNNRKSLNLSKERAIKFIYRGWDLPFLPFNFLSLLASPLAIAREDRSSKHNADFVPIEIRAAGFASKLLSHA